MQEFNGSFEMIDPRVILIDHRYQRPEKEALVAAISSDFKWTSFGAVTCYRRGTSVYAVDGQQRLQSALAQSPPPRAVPCVVFDQSTVEAEARSFLEIQVNRKAVSALEKHKAELLAKIPSAVAIEKAVEHVGFTIGQDPNPRSIKAIRTLHSIYTDLGEEGVIQTLVQVRDAWENDTAAINAHMLRAVADVIMELGEKYERGKMTQALSKTTPGDIARRSKSIEFDMGGSHRHNMRRAIKALCKI